MLGVPKPISHSTHWAFELSNSVILKQAVLGGKGQSHALQGFKEPCLASTDSSHDLDNNKCPQVLPNDSCSFQGILSEDECP